MEHLVIVIGRQSDGCVYQLHSRSRARIQKEFPEVKSVPNVFVGYGTRSEFEEIHGPLWWQIALLLTGLTREQLEALGGVEIYDPGTEETRQVA